MRAHFSQIILQKYLTGFAAQEDWRERELGRIS
jgi:hypothetical protein